jgi:MFS family permease
VRGRVMAIYMAIFMGGTPIGAPIVGWVANEFGPRWALGVGAASGITATVVGMLWLVKYHHLRIHYADRRLSVSHDGRKRAADLAAAQIVAAEVLSQKG